MVLDLPGKGRALGLTVRMANGHTPQQDLDPVLPGEDLLVPMGLNRDGMTNLVEQCHGTRATRLQHLDS
jgi:hypothetical protein